MKILLTFVTAIAFLSQYFFFSYLSLMKNSTALKTNNLRKSMSSEACTHPLIHSSPQSLNSKFIFPTRQSMFSSHTISITKLYNLLFFLPKKLVSFRKFPPTNKTTQPNSGKESNCISQFHDIPKLNSIFPKL